MSSSVGCFLRGQNTTWQGASSRYVGVDKSERKGSLFKRMARHARIRIAAHIAPMSDKEFADLLSRTMPYSRGILNAIRRGGPLLHKEVGGGKPTQDAYFDLFGTLLEDDAE